MHPGRGSWGAPELRDDVVQHGQPLADLHLIRLDRLRGADCSLDPRDVGQLAQQRLALPAQMSHVGLTVVHAALLSAKFARRHLIRVTWWYPRYLAAWVVVTRRSSPSGSRPAKRCRSC